MNGEMREDKQKENWVYHNCLNLDGGMIELRDEIEQDFCGFVVVN